MVNLNYTKEYQIIIDEFERKKNEAIASLKLNYINKSQFKVGQIIYNVCGVIMIDDIDIKYHNADSYYVYSGQTYKWLKGGLVTKTKYKKNIKLASYSNIKLVDGNKLVS